MEEFCVEKRVQSRIPTRIGEFHLYLYTNNRDDKEHLALVMGQVSGKRDIIVRVHSECYTGDVLGSLRCDCGEQLQSALQSIAMAGEGVLIYLRQEGRGIGLANKLKAYALQDQGLDTVEANVELGFDADLRDYGVGAQILVSLGIKKMRIMTNNPKKIKGLEGYNLEVTGRVPIVIEPRDENRRVPVEVFGWKKSAFG